MQLCKVQAVLLSEWRLNAAPSVWHRLVRSKLFFAAFAEFALCILFIHFRVANLSQISCSARLPKIMNTAWPSHCNHNRVEFYEPQCRSIHCDIREGPSQTGATPPSNSAIIMFEKNRWYIYPQCTLCYHLFWEHSIVCQSILFSLCLPEWRINLCMYVCIFLKFLLHYFFVTVTQQESLANANVKRATAVHVLRPLWK